MDAFDEVRRMNISEIPEACNNATNPNNGYHTNNDIQADYIPSNDIINTENINYKDGESATAGEFQSIESVQENQQKTNAADLEYDKETSNSAEQPSGIEEPATVEKVDTAENGNEETDKDVEEKISNGMDVDTQEETGEKKEDEEEVKKQDADEENEQDAVKKENVSKIKKEDDDEDDEENVPLAKRVNAEAGNRRHSTRNTATPNSTTPKRGPRGPYNKNRSKVEPISLSANNQPREDIAENQCRVCLVKDDLISIFKTDNKLSIADKLMTVCSGIRIQRRDFLPQFICNTCMQSVQVAYNLKVLCETTDKDLRSKLSRSKKKMRRPATEYVLLDATKFPTDESENDQGDNDDEFKLSNEERAKTSGSDPTDSGSDYGSRRRSRRVRTKKTQKKKRESRSSIAVATPKPAPVVVTKPAAVNSAPKRNRKKSSSPEKRISIDFSSGSEDNYTPPQPKLRKEPKNRSGPGPNAVNAPKEAQCPYCNEMFPSQSSLMKHKKTHSNQPLNCDMCGKVFKLLAAYQAHIDKHKSDGDSLKCDKCEKTFTKLVERKRHMIEVHNEKPETFPCEKCKRVFALKKTLEKHLEDNKCPGPRPARPPVTGAPQKKAKPEVENLTLGRDLFKCVAPVTTTYWSDSFSE